MEKFENILKQIAKSAGVACVKYCSQKGFL